MRRNISGQFVGAQLIAKADGTPIITGTTTVYVTGNAGTQATGSVGSGAATHEGNGFWTYAPAQAETNYTHVAFTFVNTNAINVSVQLYPLSYGSSGQLTGVELAADQAVNTTKVGGTTQTASDLAADIAGITAGKNDILTRLPTALVGGRMNSDVGNMQSNTITASVIASNAVNIIQAGLATATAQTTLQTSVDDVPNNSESATAHNATLAQIALVKVKSDQLTFTEAGELDVNIQSINDVGLIGDGSPGNLFRVP